MVLGNAYGHGGQLRAAPRAFTSALAAGEAIDGGFLSLTASVHWAINHVQRGQLRDAVQICREQTAAGRFSGIPVTEALHSVWGEVLREWNEMGDARRHVERGCPFADPPATGERVGSLDPDTDPDPGSPGPCLPRTGETERTVSTVRGSVMSASR